MTANERIEALLNRANQTISDLPDSYSQTRCLSVMGRHQGSYFRLATTILHMADVIDRMEQALTKVCDERDMMRKYTIDDFFGGGVYILCAERAQYDVIIKYCEMCGMNWIDGEAAEEFDGWDGYENDCVMSVDCAGWSGLGRTTQEQMKAIAPVVPIIPFDAIDWGNPA